MILKFQNFQFYVKLIAMTLKKFSLLVEIILKDVEKTSRNIMCSCNRIVHTRRRHPPSTKIKIKEKK